MVSGRERPSGGHSQRVNGVPIGSAVPLAVRFRAHARHPPAGGPRPAPTSRATHTRGTTVHLRHEVPAEGGSAFARSSSTTSGSRSIPARRSACSAPTARASPACCASWPASTRIFRARRGRRRARRSATCRRSRKLDATKNVRAERGGGGGRPAEAAQPLQRDQRRVRRAGRRLRQADGRAGAGAGADRHARPVESRQQDRDRDGCAAAAAGRCGREEAVGW